MKKYTIISNRDVDVSEIDLQLQVETLSVDNIPDRAAEVENPHSESKRITSYLLTEDEVAALKNDPRVQDVVEPTKAEIGLYTKQHANFFRQPMTASQGTNYNTTRYKPGGYPDPENTHVNWGLERCSNKGIRDYTWWNTPDSLGNSKNIDLVNGIDPDSGTNFQTIHHGVSGEGVDIVIMDSGVQVNHPDLLDADGNTRVQQIDWYSYSDTLNGTLPAKFYTDPQDHGTHVACTAAGRKNGWAKEAHIYPMHVLGNGALTDMSVAFELMLAWHRAKTDPTSPHYTGRPTVINMSWGYHSKEMGLPNPDRIHFRGVDYPGPDWTEYRVTQTFAEYYDLYGLTKSDPYDISVQVPEIDALTEELVDAGATICIASGNRGDIMVKDPNHQDYNNRLEWDDPDIDDMHYMRPCSPFAEGAIYVANLSSVCRNLQLDSEDLPTSEMLSSSSGRGQAIDIIAPGTKIRAGMPEWTTTVSIKPETFTARHYVDIDNPDPMHTEKSWSGTSMASPQVAGVAALHLSSKPNLTPAQVKTRILTDAEEVTNLSDKDWTTHLSEDYWYRPPEHTPIRFGKGYYNITESAIDTTNKLLHSRYSNPPVEMKGAFTLTSTTGQGTAGPDYTTHSTITAASAMLKRFTGLTNEITITAKTAADTPATKSVGNIKLFALHGFFEQVSDNQDGTYTARYRPKLGDTSITETITAAIRPHGEPKYKTLTNSATFDLTPTEVRTNSIVTPYLGKFVFSQYRYSNSNTGLKIYVDWADTDELGSLTAPMSSLGTFQNTGVVSVPRPAIIRPSSSKPFIDFHYEYSHGRHIVYGKMPDTPQNSYEQTLEINTGSGFSAWSKSPVVDVLPYYNFEETSIIEAWPPICPADGKAKQSVRCIPKTDTGAPQKTFVGKFLTYVINTSDDAWDNCVRETEGRSFYLENWKKEDVDSNSPDAVVYRTDYVSSVPCKGAYEAEYHIAGKLPTMSYPAFEKQADAEFSDSDDAYRAYYSRVLIDSTTATSATFIIEVQTENTLIDTGTYPIRLWNPSEEVWVDATRAIDRGPGTWTCTLNFSGTGRFEIQGQINGMYFKDRPIFISSGTDFTTHSEITINPAGITAAETANITVQARGSAGLDAGSSAGPLTLSASKGTIFALGDNKDGTYTAKYFPPSDITGPDSALISGNFSNYGAITDTATITLNAAEWHKYATFTVQSNKINEKLGTEITCTIRRKNNSPLMSSIGPIAFTTSKGVITPAIDNGNGSYTATLTTGGLTSGSATVRATIFGKATDNSASVAFEQAPDFSLYSTLTSDSATVSGDGEDLALLTLTIKGTADTNHGVSIGNLSVTPSIGTIHNITDNENGTYNFHYLPPMTLASSTPVNFTISNGAYTIIKNSVINVQGVSNFNTDIDITVGEGSLSGWKGYWSHASYSFWRSVSVDEYDPLISYGDEGVLVPDMGQVNTWKLPSIPLARPDYIMWHKNAGSLMFKTYTGLNAENIDIEDYTTNFAFEVATFTPPADTGKVAVNFNRIDASFTPALHSQKWVWDIDSSDPLIDSTNGEVYNMSLTQDIPINVTYASHSTVTANPTTIEGDGTQSSTITVQLKTAATTNATVSGGVVTLSATGGSLSPVVDNQDGTYTATYTSISAATHTINATINGVAISDNTEVVVTSSGSINYTNHSTVEVVNDVYDKAITTAVTKLILSEVVSGLEARNPGYSFVLNQGGREVDNGDGTTTRYDFGDLNSSGEFSAADAVVAMSDIDGARNNANVELLLKRLSASYALGDFTDTSDTTLNLWTSKPSSEMVYKDGSSTTKIKVQLKTDATTNATASKGTVTFTGNGTFSDITDNQDGSYTATYTAPVTTQGSQTSGWDLTPETDTIQAFLDGVQILDTTVVELHEPAFCATTAPTNIPDEVVVGQSFTFNVPVRRQDHALVTGSVGDIIDFIPYTGVPEGAAPTITNATDLNNGNYSFLFTAGNMPISDALIGVRINNTELFNYMTYTVPIISQDAIYGQHSTLTASPSSINLGSSSTITLQIKNLDGTNFESSIGTVTMALGAGQHGTLGAITDHSDGTYTAVYTAPSTGGATSVDISATINGSVVVTDTATINLMATSFTDQTTVTVGEFEFVDDSFWYGAAYNSQAGSYLFGSINDTSWAPSSAVHIDGLLAIGQYGSGSSGGGEYATRFSLNTMQVGGSYSELPVNIETSFQTMKVHNTTLYRSDASSYEVSTDDTAYQRIWTWFNTGNLFETTTTGTTRVVTWDPVD